MNSYRYPFLQSRMALLILVVLFSLTVNTTALAAPQLSEPGIIGSNPSPPLSQEKREYAELMGFLPTVIDPQRSAVPVGVFSSGVLANPILQQPAGNGLFVSTDPEAITQFRLATEQGSLGLLAHNTLAGKLFYNLKTGDDLYIVYGSGRYEHYVIYNYSDYRAITPRLFEDLKTGKRYSDYEVFYRVYTGNGEKLVLQTCLERDGKSTWGRRFIFAMRVDGSQHPESRAFRQPD